MNEKHELEVDYPRRLFLPEYNTSYSRWTPPVTQARMSAGFEKNLAQGTYADGVRVLVDFSQVTRIEGTLREMQAIVRRVNREGRGYINRNLHVLYAPDTWVFGDVRRYQNIASAENGIRVEVCQSEADALAALEIEYDTFEGLFQSTTVIDLWSEQPI